MLSCRRHRALLLGCIVLNLMVQGAKCQSLKNRVERMEAYLDKQYSQNHPGAVVLVAQNGRPILNRAWGLADLERQIALTPDHVLPIGSLSKQFTALAVLMLDESGQLSIHDSLTKYFPDAVNFKDIELIHLLTHSSGIKDLFQIEAWREDLKKDLSRQQTLDLIKAEKPGFLPGTRSEYSNSGYYLLGLIVEQVTGTSLNSFIRKRILEPAGMNRTGFLDGDSIASPTAKGYEKKNGEVNNPAAVSKSRFFAGGSIVTTAGDLLKWDEQLYSGELAGKDAMNLFFTPFVLTDGQDSGNACGWEMIQYKGIKIYGHGGGINGYVCQAYRVPERHLYVLVMSNLIDRDGKVSTAGTAQNLSAMMLDDAAETESKPGIVLSAEELEKYAGEYRLPDQSIRRLVVQDRKLWYQVSAERKAELIPQSKSVFLAGRASTFRFVIDDNDRVLSFELDTGRGRPVKAVKIK